MKNDSDKTPLTDDRLKDVCKTALDGSVARIDPEVRQRLKQARHEAVRAAAQDQLHLRQTYRKHMPWLIPAGGVAAVVLALSVMFNYWVRFADDQSPLASMEDMPLLTAPEDLELYEELDFYQWLAVEHERVG